MPWVYLSYFSNRPRDNANPYFSFLKQYDAEHGTEYYPTLRAYLLCEQDSRKMAEFLHIHKNTVNYRLRKIAEIYPINLRDCRVITDLYLSLFDELLDGRYMPGV